MTDSARTDPRLSAAAERQMRAWARSTEIADRELRAAKGRLRADDPHHPPLVKKTYLTVSRETGAGAAAVAAIVGDQLGWKVYNKNLLDLIAERYNLPRMMLDLVDETQSSWVFDALGTWMDRAVIPHQKYVRYVKSMVRSLAKRERAIFIGRAAQCCLPRENGMHVHLVAPLKARVERVCQREGLSPGEAKQSILEKDRGRREFVERFFHRSLDELSQFHLVLNTERLGIAGTAEHILAEMVRE